MPNNGIISRYATVPEEFKVNTTTEFDNTTDTIVVNKALNGIKVEQKAVTLNQLAGMVGGGEAGPQGPMGPQGPAGPAVPSGLDWQGEYATETNYAFNDVVTWVNPDTSVLGSYWVTDEGGVYNIAPTDNSGVINTGWAFLASQGPQGIQGPVGPQGIVGPQGPAGTATFPYKEAFVLINPQGNNPIAQIYSTLSNPISVTKNGLGAYSLGINANDKPSSPTKCQIISQPTWGNTGTSGIYNLQFQTSAVTSVGVIAFWVYRHNTTTGVFELADLPSNLALNIRFYN